MEVKALNYEKENNIRFLLNEKLFESIAWALPWQSNSSHVRLHQRKGKKWKKINNNKNQFQVIGLIQLFELRSVDWARKI